MTEKQKQDAVYALAHDRWEQETEEDRHLIAGVLTSLFNALNLKTGVTKVEYIRIPENMKLTFKSGAERYVNVEGDSPTACIKDIMKAITD